MIFRMEDLKRGSRGKTAAGLVLAVGITGCASPGELAAPDDTTSSPGSPGTQASSAEVVSMRLLTDGAGWVADQKHLLWTRDNGQQWTDITPIDLDAQQIQQAVFPTERDGWIVTGSETGGELAVWTTRDGGASWTSQALTALGDGGAVIAMDVADAAYGWVMVQLPSSANFSHGLLLATTDGGQSWKALPEPPIAGAIRFQSRSTGWLAGGPAGDQLYVTRDGGEHWERRAVSPPSGVDGAGPAIYQPPRFRGDAEGVLQVQFSGTSGALLATYETTDAGETWRSKALVALPAGDELSSQQAIVGMDFQTADRGWLTVASGQCAAGKSQCRQDTRLFTTTDGGRTMQDITPGALGRSPGAGTRRISLTTGKGFDKCAIGSVSQMQAWWTSTPWSWANVYIGGTNRACGQSGLTASWVRSVFAQGWRLVPTWVGLQAPGSSCTGCSKMSTSATTARQQGINEANAAADAVAALGFPAPTIIYFDMERYDPTSHPAARAFINAWVERLRQRGHQAGVYGAGANASNDWAPIANPPQAVWIAQWNNVESVFGLSGLSDSLWTNHQRIHQFRGPHNETWGGVTFNIDSNRADGPVADD